MIFSLSKGLTTVLDAAPANPPAIKYDETSGLKTSTVRFFRGSDCSASTCDVLGCDVMTMLTSSFGM